METVTGCTKVRDWTKDGKSVPIYSVVLSNGQTGESFGKEIPIGTPITDLEITPNGNYAPKIKLKGATNSGVGYGGKRSGNESFALSYAKDLGVAYVSKGTNIDPNKICAWADIFYNWLENKKVTQPNPIILASQLPPKETPKASTPLTGNPAIIPNDDLPF